MAYLKKIKLTDYHKTVVFNYAYIATNIITGFVLFPLIIKYLGMTALSVFGIFYSIKSFVDLGVGWLSASVTKNLIRHNRLKSSIFTFSLLWNSTYAVIGFFIFVFYGYFVKSEFLLSSITFGIFVFFSFLSIPFYEMLTSELKQSLVAAFRFLQQLSFFALSVTIFMLAYSKSLDHIFLSLAISASAVFLILFAYYRKSHQIFISFKRIKKNLIYKLVFSDGKNIFLNAVILISLLQIDVLMLDYLYGSISVALYLIIWKIPNTIIMLGWTLSSPFQVIVAKSIANRERVYIEFKKLEIKILFIAIIFGLLYLIFGRYALEIWIGKENVPNIEHMFLIPSIVIFLSITSHLYESVVFYTKKINVSSALMLVVLSLKIISTIVLFDIFKELSPIVGWAIGLVLTILFQRRNAIKIVSPIKTRMKIDG